MTLKAFGLTTLLRAKSLEPLSLDLGNLVLPVHIRRSARAKRLILRLSRNADGLDLTLPSAVSLKRASRFVEASRAWVTGQLAKHHIRTKVVEQGCVIHKGERFHLLATGVPRGLITVDDEQKTISVPGDSAHLNRRLVDWQKAQARLALTAAAKRYAEAMHTNIGRISIRDQRSRWGSCAANGDLSFSWRLIKAPSYILDYVAAHEVAHRLHMDHSPAYWRFLMRHNPHVKEAKQWFKLHGASLHADTSF